MKVTVSLLAAAVAAASVASAHAQTYVRTTSSTIGSIGPTAATVESTLTTTNKTLTQIGTTSKALTKTPQLDMLLPVQVHSMQQTRGGTFLQFNFGTTAPAGVMICLSTTWIEPAPSVSGGWTVAGSVERLAFSPTGINHSVVVKSLDPNTVYFAVILLNPPDEYNIAGWLPYHTFDKTLKRKVTVSIPMIFVIDDSDDLSAGDLAFRFQIGHPDADFRFAGNTWDHEEDPSPSGYFQIDSGDDYWPIVNLHGVNVGDEVKVAVSCIDNDSMYGGQFNSPDEYLGSGCNSVAEWNSGWWIFDISGGTDMSPGDTPAENERFSYDFIKNVNETDDTCLEYQVWGSVSVSYVP
jgi:hypothetical protein